jgi:hypothetical protein
MLLLAAGYHLLRSGDPEHVLYGAMAAALVTNAPDVEPLLVGAVLGVTAAAGPDAGPLVMGVVEAMDDASVGPENILIAALTRELAAAIFEAGRTVFETRAEVEATAGVPQEWT